MEILPNLGNNQFSISLSLSETEVVQDILKRSLELISDPDFKIMTGFAKSEAQLIVSTIQSIKQYKNNQCQGIHKLEFSRDDLLLLHNSMNIVCNGVYICDFQAEIGVSREWIASYLDRTHELLCDH